VMAGAPTSGRLPPEGAAALLDQAFRLWIEPAIAERGLTITRADVVKALVAMPPSQPPLVLINDDIRDDVALIARVRAARPIEAGQTVTPADYSSIEDLLPFGIDPNAAWVALAKIGDEIVISFDARRNRQTAESLIERALEFADASNFSLTRTHLGPAIENAFAAIELAVKAQMYLLDDSPTQFHHERLRWWSKWVRLGNAPAESASVLQRLYTERGASRYGDGPITMASEDVRLALDRVLEVIEHARLRCSERPSEGPSPAQ
jgi:HEPN domain-containing protein